MKVTLGTLNHTNPSNKEKKGLDAYETCFEYIVLHLPFRS